MHAIIETGGKQYYVKEEDVIDIERLEISGDKIEFDRVLFLHNGSTTKIGAPHLKESRVFGELMQEVRGPKIISFKYKKRKNYRKKIGHRQKYLRVKITEIKE